MKTEIINEVLFTIDKDHASASPFHKHTSDTVVVPSEVEGVPVRLFKYNQLQAGAKIKHIKLPASIEDLKIEDCKDFTITIEIDEDNPYLYSDGKAVYTKDRRKLIWFSARGDREYTIQGRCTTIMKNAFHGSEKLKRVVFPKGLRKIDDFAFANCDELSALRLPDKLYVIGNYAFTDCPKLKLLSFPSELKKIGELAFRNNARYLAIRLPKTLKKIDGSAFPENWTLTIDKDNPHFIERGGYILSRDGKRLVCIAKTPKNGIAVIPKGVCEIAPNAFCSREDITKVILPAGLHTIGDHAFGFARQLRNIELGNVRSIGEGAFFSCMFLERISLKCDHIGAKAFEGCLCLTEAEIDCKTIGEEMFKDCFRLRRVILNNTRRICKEAFYVAQNLKELVLPDGLAEIGDRAFSLSGIKVLKLPKTVKHIGACIADNVREIHIYDNIETEINENNDISCRSYNLYVHSAKTDEVKYVVPIVGNILKNVFFLEQVHKELVNMFRGGVDFDFKKYDSYFPEVPDEYNKFAAGITRLKDGYELDDKTRRSYERQLGEISYNIVMDSIYKNDTDKLFAPELYKYTSIESMLKLVDMSAENQMTELTAFLMQICSEKR